MILCKNRNQTYIHVNVELDSLFKIYLPVKQYTLNTKTSSKLALETVFWVTVESSIFMSIPFNVFLIKRQFLGSFPNLSINTLRGEIEWFVSTIELKLQIEPFCIHPQHSLTLITRKLCFFV